MAWISWDVVGCAPGDSKSRQRLRSLPAGRLDRHPPGYWPAREHCDPRGPGHRRRDVSAAVMPTGLPTSPGRPSSLPGGGVGVVAATRSPGRCGGSQETSLIPAGSPRPTHPAPRPTGRGAPDLWNRTLHTSLARQGEGGWAWGISASYCRNSGLSAPRGGNPRHRRGHSNPPRWAGSLAGGTPRGTRNPPSRAGLRALRGAAGFQPACTGARVFIGEK